RLIHGRCRAYRTQNMNSDEIEKRKPVWLAISEFYLDTELETDDALRIRETFRNSGYSLSELKNIDFYEVKPIVGMNLWSTAGEWEDLMNIGFGIKFKHGL
ncbi:MAG: hypothetical protein JXQ96_21785, partial [Cyclobacteriaceae bacterium]